MPEEEPTETEETEEAPTEASEKTVTCSRCKKKFSNQVELMNHVRVDHKEEIKEAKAKKIEEEELETPLSADEQMFSEMKETLKTELDQLPGIVPKNTKWVLHRFETNKTLREDDLRLFNLLKNAAPKASSEDINWIVDNVMTIRDSYGLPAGRKRMFKPGRTQPLGRYRGYEGPERPEPYDGIYASSRERGYFEEGRPPGGKAFTENELEKRVEERIQAFVKEKRRKDEVKNLKDSMQDLAETMKKMQSGEIEGRTGEAPLKDKLIDAIIKEKILGKKEETGETSIKDKLIDAIIESKILGKGEETGVKKEDIEGMVSGVYKDFKNELDKRDKDQTITHLQDTMKEVREEMRMTRSQGQATSGEWKNDDSRLVAEGLRQIGTKMDRMGVNVEKLGGKAIELFGGMPPLTTQKTAISDKEKTEIEKAIDEKIKEEEGVLGKMLAPEEKEKK